MLGVKAYTPEYLADCRARIAGDLAAYDKIPGPVPDQFEARYFNSMVLVLEYLFVHRLRTVEGKDGNPANEVRILCNSIVNNRNVMTADNVGGQVAFSGLNPIKMNPEKTVLGHKPGDTIALTRADFGRLANAFFDEIERKFV